MYLQIKGSLLKKNLNSDSMPSLQVKNLPQELYEALKVAAARERRSINQQAIVALEKGLKEETDVKAGRKKLLDKIESGKDTWKDWHTLDIVSLISKKKR